MSSIDELTRALSEITVARLIAIPHDEARVRYPLSFNTVSNYRGFENAISDYTIYHYGACIIPGARFPRYEALGIGKRIIEQAYRRRGSDI
ncbi:MAG: hypothetical protein KJ052_11465, partial [Candidatus Hydrogenedentes bacterium]|nr:hypothetical protein [Candidatus Hydrogenedentota bacterium]